MPVARYSVEDGYALAVLVMRYPQARIYDLPSGRWVGHTHQGLHWADSLDDLREHLAEVYAEPGQVIPLRPGE